MFRITVLLIALLTSSCSHTNKNQHESELSSLAASSLLGKNKEQAIQTYTFTHQQNINNRELPPPTVVKENFSPSPAMLQAKKEYENLSQAKKRLLAQSIVMAADWEKLYREFNEAMDDYTAARQAGLNETMMSRHVSRSDQVMRWIVVAENPYIQSVLWDLRREKDLAPLIDEARQSKCPIFDYLDIFEIVIDNYIEIYPADKRGWDFLWFMMLMEEEEAPQFHIIKEYIQQKRLTRFPYGQKIWGMVKDYGYVEAIPSGRQPLERL